MATYSWPSKPLVYTLIGLAFWTFLDLQAVSKYSDNGRRTLATTTNISYLKSESTLLPWAHYNLRSVKERPDPSSETALFWHIPKSGGTTAKQIYQCMGKALTIRIGVDPRYGHDQSDELVVFKPIEGKDWKTVNVDTVSEKGILRAEEMGLVASGKADIIFAMDVNFASSHLFDRLNKGRILSIFRHPVDRLASKFYYLQSATWERTYRPEWADMSILEWAEKHNEESNVMVKKLAGVKFHDTATEAALRVAMRTLEKRFVVGLTDNMKESIRRFNIVMNIDLTSNRNQNCMRKFFGHGTLKTNSNPHPKLEPGSPAWDVLARDNALDIQLYEYILVLFDQQGEVIDSYARGISQ
mmetsp:Transcript_20585/g.31768  ORF Transcript_20585/g.31768 Transcript_20585/m.31768 type:complete len:356 (-) Transcript_20585:68-1135(-)